MIKTTAQAEALLRTYIPTTPLKSRYTLDRMQALLAYLGNPQEKLRVVHIAGTSGKTSTAYFIRALAQAGGVRTGLTISPHMESIAERVQINGSPLPQAAFVQHFNEFLPLLEASTLRPTYFEIVIAFAFWVFTREQVELAIIETGLGGLLDATNTVRRPDKLGVITDIGLDHTEILGETLPEIAAQKAGIIQPGNTVVALDQPAEVLAVIQQTAVRKQATLHIAQPATLVDLAPFQQRNFGAARAAYTQLGLPAPSLSQIKLAATQTPPGRLETYTVGGKTVIVDGAHNAQKLGALRQALTARHVQKTVVMCNMVSAPPAKIQAAITELVPLARRVIVPDFSIAQDFNGRKATDPTELAALITSRGTPAQAIPDLTTALTELLNSPEDMLVVTGSLYLAQAVRPLLQNLS